MLRIADAAKKTAQTLDVRVHGEQRFPREHSPEDLPAGVDGHRDARVQVIQTRQIFPGGAAVRIGPLQVTRAGVAKGEERRVQFGQERRGREHPPKIGGGRR